MQSKALRRSFLVPIGYVDCDETDYKIEAMLPPSAKISRIDVKQRRGVSLAKITFTANADEVGVPRRFLIHPAQLVKDNQLFDDSSWPADWIDYNLTDVGSLVDASGETWWVFEDQEFVDEVAREGVNLAQLELESEVTAVHHLCMLTIPELRPADKVTYVYVSGFSDEAVDEYVGRNQLDYDEESGGYVETETVGVLEYLRRLRRIALI